mgnify:CR=1 FL=1
MELIPFMFVFVLAFAVITMLVMAVDDCCSNRNLLYIVAGFGYGCLTIALIAGFALMFI